MCRDEQDIILEWITHALDLSIIFGWFKKHQPVEWSDMVDVIVEEYGAPITNE
jgi:hypothetical protein